MTVHPHPAETLDADVVIVGGGLVGGTLACALGGAGMDVVVVDREDPETALDAAFDGRASAIALASQRLLGGVGLWGELKARAAPILDIRVADASSPLALHGHHQDQRRRGQHPGGIAGIQGGVLGHGLAGAAQGQAQSGP